METQTLAPDFLNEKVMKVTGDILSQAITGELIGMANFAALAGTIDDYHEKMEAVEHAESERQHAIGFMKMAKKHNIEPIINLKGTYWNSIHQSFLTYANKKDFVACLIIQEVMLESFAVAMYRDAGNALGNEIGDLLIMTSEQEKEHLSHATELLKDELIKHGDAFIDKFHRLHEECMMILAQWSANSDVKGHCGVCNGNCMKEDLGEIGLSTRQMRAGALKTYAEALDMIGLPSEKTTVWILNLPI